MKRYILFFTVAGIFSLSAGCTETGTMSTEPQVEHLALVDQKIREVEQRLTNTDTHYLKLDATLKELCSKIESQDNSVKTIISETQKNISDILNKLNEIEKAKADMQNQISALQAQRSRIIDPAIERQGEAAKVVTVISEDGYELIKESTSEGKPKGDKSDGQAAAINNDNDTTQRLLNEALALYRGGNYTAATSKWEEVLDNNIISETQKNIGDLARQLSEIAKAKADLQSRVSAFQSQKSRSADGDIKEQGNVAVKEASRVTIEKGHEIASESKTEEKPVGDKKVEEAVAGEGRDAVKKLLEEAVTLYRDEKYNEAICNWEKVLKIDPENLEAKYNIEIVTEKVKSPSPRSEDWKDVAKEQGK